jgi:hypothetical protein
MLINIKMKRISNELNQLLLILLIFLIIFRDNIDFLRDKYVYYLMYIIFIISIFVLKNEPGILLLYSCLFILVWYKHNIVIINDT